MQIIFSPRKFFAIKKKSDFALNLAKIFIIVFVSIYLLGNFQPFYEGKDAYFYGIVSVNLSEGIFSTTNELLQETGRDEFVGSNWIKTVHNTTVPQSGTGLSAIGAFFYLVGGYHGLFYLSSIFAILLLIFSERIATNLFGKYVGFLTLLFLGTSNLLYRNSIELQTEGVLSFLFILGTFYLVKYLRQKKDSNLLLASILFAVLPFIKLSAVAFFPVEILLVSGYFVIQVIKQEKPNITLEKKNSIRYYSGLFFSKFMRKKTLKTTTMILVPWLIFIASYMIYHDYYFGDPLTNYGSLIGFDYLYDTSPSSFVKFEIQNFENVKEYSKYLLPYQLPAVYNRADQNLDDIFGNNWLGIIALLGLFSTLLASLYSKNKRLEMIVFTSLIAANVWFFSAITTEERAATGVAGRFMLPVFTLSSMMFGFLIFEFFKSKLCKKKLYIQKTLKSLKIVVFVILLFFFLFSFYYWPTVEGFIEKGLKFKNPDKYASRYPLDMEGLSENSVILAQSTDRVIDYGFIPFSLDQPKSISQESIDLLRKTIQDSYEVYVFKEPTSNQEKESLKFLISNHGIILKDYSNSFCKIELTDKKDGTQMTDQICIEN